MDSQILVQRITLTWTKASRGGEGARRRNALPKVLPLPLEALIAPLAVHRVLFEESADFDRIESVERMATLAEVAGRDMVLAVVGERLEVQFIRDRNNAAVAERNRRDQSGQMVYCVPAFPLTFGQWGQLLYNGRYVDRDTGIWWYEQQTINVGFFAGATTGQFVASRPSKRFVELAVLR